jgi:hypothetical protein
LHFCKPPIFRYRRIVDITAYQNEELQIVLLFVGDLLQYKELTSMPTRPRKSSFVRKVFFKLLSDKTYVCIAKDVAYVCSSCSGSAGFITICSSFFTCPFRFPCCKHKRMFVRSKFTKRLKSKTQTVVYLPYASQGILQDKWKLYGSKGGCSRHLKEEVISAEAQSLDA